MIEEKILNTLTDLIASPSTMIIGIGNTDRGDDGVGLILAEKIKARFPKRAFLESEKSVEGWVLNSIENSDFKSILFIDATSFGGQPGEIKLFTSEDIQHFQFDISTHKVPISLLMEMIVQKGKDPYLLGIQPGNVEFMGEMSLPVQEVIIIFQDFLYDF